MNKFRPNIYKKNILEIDYKKLKEMGKTTLVFDLDNTIALIDDDKCSDEVFNLIRKLQDDFLIIILSNNVTARINPYKKYLGIDGYGYGMKPFMFKLIKIRKKYKLKKKEMVMIGDQIVTDVLVGNRFRITTILVDPLGMKDLKITSFNRFFEDRILKMFKKKGIFERGKYYE